VVIRQKGIYIIFRKLDKLSDKLFIEELKEFQDRLSIKIKNREAVERRNSERYDCFKQGLKKAKEFFNSLEQSKLEELKVLHSRLIAARTELIQVFSSKQAHQVCHQCKGRCCSSLICNLEDVAYLALLNFQLPEPQKYASSFEVRPDYWESYCPFLSKNGCSLKENKSFICLKFCCEKLTPVIDYELLLKIRSALENLQNQFDKILNRIGFLEFMGGLPSSGYPYYCHSHYY